MNGRFTATYGRNPGVLMAVNTKSGGQRYHGTLYEFNRQNGFDANNYFNNSPLFYKLQFDRSRPAYSDQYYKDFGGRVTWQATTKQKITLSENWQSACACYMSVGGTAGPESVQSFVYGPEKLTQFTWTYPLTNKLLIEAGYIALQAESHPCEFRKIEIRVLPR